MGIEGEESPNDIARLRMDSDIHPLEEIINVGVLLLQDWLSIYYSNNKRPREAKGSMPISLVSNAARRSSRLQDQS